MCGIICLLIPFIIIGGIVMLGIGTVIGNVLSPKDKDIKV